MNRKEVLRRVADLQREWSLKWGDVIKAPAEAQGPDASVWSAEIGATAKQQDELNRKIQALIDQLDDEPATRSAVDDPDTWLRLQQHAGQYLTLPDLDVAAELRRSYKRDPKGRFSSGGGGSGASAPAKKAIKALAQAGAATGDDAIKAAALKVEPTEAQHAAIARYGGDGSYIINAGLRSNGGDPTKLEHQRHRDAVSGMDSVMSSAQLPTDVVVHRRAATEHVFGSAAGGDMTGLTWRDDAYVSTSAEPRQAWGGIAQMRIRVPAGTRAFSHSLLDSDEIVLDRGLTFRVVRDQGGQSGETRHLDVEVVPT